MIELLNANLGKNVIWNDKVSLKFYGLIFESEVTF